MIIESKEFKGKHQSTSRVFKMRKLRHSPANVSRLERIRDKSLDFLAVQKASIILESWRKQGKAT